MGAAHLEKLMRRMYQAIDSHDLEALASLVGPTYHGHGIMMEGEGPEAFARTAATFYSAFPDLRIVAEQTIAQGEYVASRGYWTGTHQGAFGGVNPTQHVVQVGFLDMWHVQDGKFVGSWAQMDLLGLMQQLGAVSAHA